MNRMQEHNREMVSVRLSRGKKDEELGGEEKGAKENPCGEPAPLLPIWDTKRNVNERLRQRKLLLGAKPAEWVSVHLQAEAGIGQQGRGGEGG